MFYLDKRRSLTWVEFLLVICIILILIGVFAVYINITLRIARENALTNELCNIRLAIELYRVMNGKFPPDLTTLIKKGFTIKDLMSIMGINKYFKAIRVDREGNPLDPFLHKYSYDSSKGQVSSGTKGYENW